METSKDGFYSGVRRLQFDDYRHHGTKYYRDNIT